MPEIYITDAQAAHAMRQYGGQFMKRLGDCWLAGDPMNQARLKQAFEPEFERYRQLAARDETVVHAGGVPNIELAAAHYGALAREAAERQGEEVLPEHQQ